MTQTRSSKQPHPLNIELIRHASLSYLDNKTLATTALVSQKMHHTALDLKIRDLVDLLEKDSHVDAKFIDQAKKEYQDSLNKKNEPQPTSCLPSFFSCLFSSAKKSEPSPNLYHHLLKTFRDALEQQVLISGCVQSTGGTSYNRSGLSYSYHTGHSAEKVARYIKHFCAIDPKAAGEIVAETAKVFTTSNYDQFEKRSRFVGLALLESGADIKVACEKEALTNAVKHNHIDLLKSLAENKKYLIDSKYYEAALGEALFDANYPCADIIFQNCAKLNVNNTLHFTSLYEYSPGSPVNESMVRYLFSHGVTPLDLAHHSYKFTHMVRGIADEKHPHTYDFKQPQSILQKLAKTHGHKQSPAEIVQALFKNLSAPADQLVKALKTNSHENTEKIHDYLMKLHKDIQVPPTTIMTKKMKAIEETIYFAQGLLRLYKVAETMELEKAAGSKMAISDTKHIPTAKSSF